MVSLGSRDKEAAKEELITGKRSKLTYQPQLTLVRNLIEGGRLRNLEPEYPSRSGSGWRWAMNCIIYLVRIPHGNPIKRVAGTAARDCEL
jgi:hypothetical protein